MISCPSRGIDGFVKRVGLFEVRQDGQSSVRNPLRTDRHADRPCRVCARPSSSQRRSGRSGTWQTTVSVPPPDRAERLRTLVCAVAATESRRVSSTEAPPSHRQQGGSQRACSLRYRARNAYAASGRVLGLTPRCHGWGFLSSGWSKPVLGGGPSAAAATGRPARQVPAEARQPAWVPTPASRQRLGPSPVATRCLGPGPW